VDPHPTIAARVRELAGVSWSRARSLCAEGRVTVDGERCLDPAARVAPGAVVVVDAAGRKLDRGPLPKSAILHFDSDLVIVDKPAGMLTVADEDGSKETLAEYARILLRRADRSGKDAGLGVVQRLDRDTSGLIVFARTPGAQRHLAAQFRAHSIERVYHGIAHGRLPMRESKPGSCRIAETACEARTVISGARIAIRRRSAALDHARAAPRAAFGATLVECRLETGRQHQIRIHLSERGHPLVASWSTSAIIRPTHRRATDDAPCAHPGIRASSNGAAVAFERDAPEDFQSILKGLGAT
jgi:23S rRNA pseudouridine1911/1915/1917 synthase